MMKITFGEIGREKSHLHIQDDSWLPEEFTRYASGVSADVFVSLKSDDTAILEGVLAGCIALECARCGDIVEHMLQEDFYYLLTTREEEISDLPERECSDDECDTLHLKEPVIDVAEILQEQLYLAVPGKVLCSSDCKGICPECGKSLNSRGCDCSEKLPDSPFAVLKKLKKD
jgi:uncharacterized protein